MVNYSHLEEKEEEEDSSSYFSSYSSLNFGIYVFRIPSFSPIFFRFISSTRRFFFSTRSLSTSYFESLSRSKCVPLIIFGFKYQLGHAEFFSEAVYRTASWRKIDGTVNDIGPLCSNKSEEREGRGERENRVGRLHLTGNSKIVSRRKRRLFGSELDRFQSVLPKVMFAALHEIPRFRPIIVRL